MGQSPVCTRQSNCSFSPILRSASFSAGITTGEKVFYSLSSLSPHVLLFPPFLLKSTWGDIQPTLYLPWSSGPQVNPRSVDRVQGVCLAHLDQVILADSQLQPAQEEERGISALPVAGFLLGWQTPSRSYYKH